MFLLILIAAVVASKAAGLPTSMLGWVVIIIAWTIIEVLWFVGSSSFKTAHAVTEGNKNRAVTPNKTGNQTRSYFLDSAFTNR